MPQFSDGQKLTKTEWARLLESIPASYVVWKDGDTYRAECLLKGGTDYSGTNASAVIQSALNALTSGRTWKEKVVLKGDITINSQLEIPSYTILEILGKLTLASATQTNVLYLKTGATQIEIHGGIIDGNKTNNPDKGIDGDQCGIYGSAINNLWIHNLIVKNCTREGIYISNAQSLHIQNVETWNNGGAGFSCDANTWVSVNDLISRQDGTTVPAIYIVGGSTQYDRPNDFSHIFVHNPGNIGVSVYMCKFGVNLHAVEVINAASEGILINNSKNVNLVSCHVRESKYQGISIKNSEKVTIINSVVRNNGQAKNGYEYGFWVYNSSDIQILFSRAFDDQGANATQRYGLWSENDVAALDLILNYFDGNAAGNVHCNSASVHKIEGNIGYVTENSGTVTIPNGQSSVTFAHGLAGAPTVVVLGAKHSEVADAIWSADATNITITVPSNVTADRQISWYAEYKP